MRFGFGKGLGFGFGFGKGLGLGFGFGLGLCSGSGSGCCCRRASTLHATSHMPSLTHSSGQPALHELPAYELTSAYPSVCAAAVATRRALTASLMTWRARNAKV